MAEPPSNERSGPADVRTIEGPKAAPELRVCEQRVQQLERELKAASEGAHPRLEGAHQAIAEAREQCRRVREEWERAAGELEAKDRRRLEEAAAHNPEQSGQAFCALVPHLPPLRIHEYVRAWLSLRYADLEAESVAKRVEAARGALLEAIRHQLGDAKRKQAALLDDGDWDAAVSAHTLEACELYQDRHPNGRHIDACLVRATQLREDRHWRLALAKRTRNALGEYLKRWPDGRHVEEAQQRWARWDAEHAWHWIRRGLYDSTNNKKGAEMLQTGFGAASATAAHDLNVEIRADGLTSSLGSPWGRTAGGTPVPPPPGPATGSAPATNRRPSPVPRALTIGASARAPPMKSPGGFRPSQSWRSCGWPARRRPMKQWTLWAACLA